jgi:Asp-tRNA(Asn)/Glu-tRNA(Gln) amidotransferase A subunit family amidase
MTSGPVVEVSEAVRRRGVRVVDTVTEALRRIERLDGDLNAVVALRAEEALAEADEMDRRGPGSGRLAGVPVLVKDLEDVAGLPTRKGSLLLADAPPADRDGLAPARLRAAGAIIVGKTALSEFACEGYTANLLTGVTRNPWATAFSPGGSSGGSAAALAAGMVPVATATDGAGSIRIPAAFCGLVGIKPTHNLVARRPISDWIDLSTDGPFATTVADLRLLLDVLAGAEAGDPDVAPGQGIRGGQAHPDLPTRLFVAERTSDLGPLPAPVASAFASAWQAFADVAAAPVEHLPPLFGGERTGHVWYAIASAEHIAALGRDFVRNGLDRMHPGTRDFMSGGLEVGVDEYLAARRRRFDFVRVVDDLLGNDRLLVTPTVAAAGFLAEGRLRPEDPIGAMPGNVYSTLLQSLTGHPAVTLPAGSCGDVPFGLQVTAPRYADGWLLDLAARWEAAYPWRRTASGYDPFAVT